MKWMFHGTCSYHVIWILNGWESERNSRNFSKQEWQEQWAMSSYMWQKLKSQKVSNKYELNVICANAIGAIWTMSYKAKITQVLKLATASGIGAAVGISITSSKENELKTKSLISKRPPGLPIFASVSAAEPIRAPLAPVPTEPAVPVPKKELGIPPEPAPGTNRIAEIMRFGFPGLDNIRSHKCVATSHACITLYYLKTCVWQIDSLLCVRHAIALYMHYEKYYTLLRWCVCE